MKNYSLYYDYTYSNINMYLVMYSYIFTCNPYTEICNSCAWFGVYFSNPKSLAYVCICYKTNNKNDFINNVIKS